MKTKKNRISESQRMLERCISLEPRFVQAYLELLHVTPEEEKKQTLDKLIELEPMNWEHRHLYGNWLKGRGLWQLSLSYYTSALQVSLVRERGALPALRAAGLLLRAAGQRARLLRLMISWQSRAGGAGAAARRRAAAAAWRLRSELEGRAARYTRKPVTISTCLHHSQLEVSPGAYEQNILVKHPRTISEPIDVKIKSSCQKLDNKKSLSISAQYKPIHNKSDSGIKQKSCPLHKNKKIKEQDTLPYVTSHLLKTC